MKPGFQLSSDSESESAFMPMVDALFVILSIFFVAFIIMSAPKEAEPDNRARKPISIPTDQYFETDSFQLSDDNRRNLRRILSDSLQSKYELLDKENQLDQLMFIIVEGHADKRPRPTSHYSDITKIRPRIDGNEELSYFRAFTVYREITAIFDSLAIFTVSDSVYNGTLIVAGAGSRSLKCKTIEDCENNGEIASDDSPPVRDPDDIPQNRRIEIHFIFDKISGEDNAEL